MAKNRYAAKLLFQFRVIGVVSVRRICEERIVTIRAANSKKALAAAKRYGRGKTLRYKNDEGREVRFELIGILDLVELGIACGTEEVWYDIYEKVRPMERRRALIPSEKELLNRMGADLVRQ
jgi:hypothetical protein